MAVNIRIRNGMEPDPEYGLGGATEGDVRGSHSDIITTLGVVDLKGGHLLVHEALTPDMTIFVDDGVGYIPNSQFDETDSDSVRFWEAVVSGEGAVIISANSSGQTRVDLICLYLNPSTEPDEYASNVAEIVVVEGSPGAGIPATPDNHLKLAEVTVINGATEIEDTNITDTRVQIRINAKFLRKRVTTIASSATPTPDVDTTDVFDITALAEAATFQAPAGSPEDGQTLVVRMEDNGAARALLFDAAYRFSTELPAPTTTIQDKTMYIGFIYNALIEKWDCLAIINNF